MRPISYLIVILLLASCNKQETSQKEIPQKEIARKAEVPTAKSTVSGQVFVVTNGRDNIKLALVEVTAIAEKQFVAFLETRRSSKHEELRVRKGELELLEREKKAAAAAASSARHKYDYSWCYEADATPSNPAACKEKLIKDRERADVIIWEKQKQIAAIKSLVRAVDSPAYYCALLPPAAEVSKTDADGKFSLSLPAGKYVVAATTNRRVFRDTEEYCWLVLIDASTPNQSLMLSNDNQVETKCKECVQPDKVP